MSREIFEILGTITPVIEPVSVDEAFLNLTGLEKLFGPPETIGQEFKRRILEGTGLTASVGIGPNRLIAKVGSEHRKPVPLIGVGISGWQKEERLQTDLFDQSEENEKDDRLLETLDRLADRFGKNPLY